MGGEKNNNKTTTNKHHPTDGTRGTQLLAGSATQKAGAQEESRRECRRVSGVKARRSNSKQKARSTGLWVPGILEAWRHPPNLGSAAVATVQWTYCVLGGRSAWHLGHLLRKSFWGGIPWLVDRGGCLQRQGSKALSLPSALRRRCSRVGLLGTACRSLMARGGRIIKKASITYKVSKHKAVPNVLSG